MKRFELYGRGYGNPSEGYILRAEYDEPDEGSETVELRMEIKRSPDVTENLPYATKYRYVVNVESNPYAIRKAAIDEFLLNGVLMDFVDE